MSRKDIDTPNVLAQISQIDINDINKASAYIKSKVLRTPLVPLNKSVVDKNIHLKLENLQEVGSFKIRGALNALGSVPTGDIGDGVFTCSAGNFAQGLAWSSRELGISCDIIVPDSAPLTKVNAIQHLGGNVIPVPFDSWWNVMTTKRFDGVNTHFIHPVCEYEVIAGNGTVGLEVLEDFPDVDTIIVPFGGGGLICGIASAIKAMKPDVKVIACEVDVAAPLTASLKAGRPVHLQDHQPTFVDGMGGKSVFPEMWNLISNLVDEVMTLTVDEIAAAVKLLAERNHVIAEGAGAAPVAAALKEAVKGKNIACVISGGNIDSSVLTQILQGQSL